VQAVRRTQGLARMSGYFITARLVQMDPFCEESCTYLRSNHWRQCDRLITWNLCLFSFKTSCRNPKLYSPATGAAPCLQLCPAFDPAFLVVPSEARFRYTHSRRLPQSSTLHIRSPWFQLLVTISSTSAVVPSLGLGLLGITSPAIPYLE